MQRHGSMQWFEERRSKKLRAERGFTLIELLVVVAIIGVIAAIATPKLITALDKGDQAQTAANIRQIHQAVEHYNIDHHHYPVVGDLGNLVTIAGNLDRQLQPDYFTETPKSDGWGHALMYGSDGTHYTLRSYGKNGTVDAAVGGKVTDFNADIIFVDGAFVQSPGS